MPLNTAPLGLTIAEAAHLISRRALCPQVLTEAILARIDEVEPTVHAYLRHDREAARAAARASRLRAEQGTLRGALDGIPFAVKDTIYTSEMPTTAGSRVPPRHDSTLNATLVTQLLKAGAILIGKLNTWEYGTGTGAVYHDLAAPVARNPWNPEYYTGGSSSGSAASVAAGTALFAIGTDTGGSVRLPAAACGVVGLKPTFGRISRYGIMPNCWSFDTPGGLTRTVKDAALLYDVIAGHDPADSVSLALPCDQLEPQLNVSIEGLRIGWIRELGADQPLASNIQAALAHAADLLRAAGASVREIALPIDPAEYRLISLPINRSECFTIHERDYLEYRELMGRSLRDKLEYGMYLRAADYLAALRRRRDLVMRTNEVFNEVDVLLLPMTTTSAPRLDDTAAVQAFTTDSSGSPFSLTGHPALSLPMGFGDDGLPLSVQLAAGYCQEGLLLRAARAIERQLPTTTPFPAPLM